MSRKNLKLLIPKSFLRSAFSEDPENDIVPDGEEDEDSEDMDEEDAYENEGITLLIHFGVKAGVGEAYSTADWVGRCGPAAQTLTLFKT